MTVASPELRRAYDSALEAYLGSGEEEILKQAHDLGRRAVDEGAGLLAVILLHQQALAALLDKENLASRPEADRLAMQFLAGCMGPFEDVQRGFQDAYSRLRELNEEYESVVAERTREFRNAESRFRAHVEQLPAVTYIESIRSRAPIYISPQIESLLGITPRQWIDDPGRWAKQIHPVDCDRILVEMSRFRDGGPSFRKEYRLMAHDGREVWVRHEASFVLDDARRPQFVQGVLMDITDRKRAEFAARDIEDRYRVLFAGSAEALLLAGQEDGRILDANESAATLLGIPVKKLLEGTLADLFPGDHQRIGRHNGSPPAGPGPPFIGVAFHPPEGGSRTVSIRASSARLGDTPCYLCVIHANS